MCVLTYVLKRINYLLYKLDMRYSQNQILALFYILLLSSCSDKDPTRELHISQLSQLALEHNMVLNINDSLTDDMVDSTSKCNFIVYKISE